jgi:hypothetical protein
MKRLLVGLIALAMLWIGCGCAETEKTIPMTVIADCLNGRSAPRKTAFVEARFSFEDPVEAIRWSKDHNWIEVYGGETGTVWVWYEYVTERYGDYMVFINDCSGKVKIRKKPYGRVIGYLKNEDEVFIEQVVLGWGRCSKGWIDLSFLTEEE